jgi:hypothetical protein
MPLGEFTPVRSVLSDLLNRGLAYNQNRFFVSFPGAFLHSDLPDTMADQLSVLFVCLGNICRSTMAEGVFQSLARKPPYEDLVGKVDSCGTGAFQILKVLLSLIRA